MNEKNAKLLKAILATMTKIQAHPYHNDDTVGTPEQLLAAEAAVNALDDLARFLEKDKRKF